MRKINKQTPPYYFSDFVNRMRPTDWRNCDNDVKNRAKEFILLEEQNLLCGYTEIYIDNEDCHIDHYIKRTLNNKLCYKWDNLIVAVNDEDFGAKCKDNGPNKVKTLTENTSILNPVQEDGVNYFKFLLNGEICPIEDLSASEIEKAKKTIEVFNLNHSSLKARRGDLAKTINELKTGGLSKDDILSSLENSGFVTFINYILNNY